MRDEGTVTRGNEVSGCEVEEILFNRRKLS
jgi:hypothetical protein